MIYLGAVLSPLILLIWLLPSFRDFAKISAKVYGATIFVLFVHVVILELVASLFTGMIASSPTHTADPLMSMIVGLAALIALLKTQSFMMQLSYISAGPRSVKKLGSEFISGISYLKRERRGDNNNNDNKNGSKKEEKSASGGEPKYTGTNNTNYKQPTSRPAAVNNPVSKNKTQEATGTTTVAPKQTNNSKKSKATKQEKLSWK